MNTVTSSTSPTPDVAKQDSKKPVQVDITASPIMLLRLDVENVLEQLKTVPTTLPRIVLYNQESLETLLEEGLQRIHAKSKAEISMEKTIESS